MRTLLIFAASIAVTLMTVPQDAEAWNDAHLSGMCSTQWEGGKGGGFMGQWGGNSVSLQVDQRGSIWTAANQLESWMDSNCVNTSCYFYNYSNGDGTLGIVLDRNPSGKYSIGYVVTAGGAGGGSEIAGSFASIFTCGLASQVTTSFQRNAYDHSDTGGANIYRLGGSKGMISSWLLPGEDDGAVAYHSAGACTNTGSYDDLWTECGSHWSGHNSWWTPSSSYDEGDYIDHYEIKMLGICMDGGVSNVSGAGDCLEWVADNA